MALLVIWISLQPDSLIFLLGESAKVSDMPMAEANGVCWLFRPIGASHQSSNFVTNDLTVLFTDMLCPLPINLPVLLAFSLVFRLVCVSLGSITANSTTPPPATLPTCHLSSSPSLSLFLPSSVTPKFCLVSPPHPWHFLTLHFVTSRL